MNKHNSIELSIIKMFHWNSIFVKYFKKTIIIIIIPFILLETLGYIYLSSTNKHQIDITLNQSFSKTSNAIESAFDTISKQTYLLRNNDYIISMLTSSNVNTSNYFWLRNLMNSAITVSPNLHSIDIYSIKSGYVYSTATSEWAKNFTYLPWYTYYLETGKASFICPIKSTPDNKNYDRLCFSQGIYYNQELYGIIVCNLNMDNLFNTTGGKLYNENTYLTDPSDVILYSNNNSMINSTFVCPDRSFDTGNDTKVQSFTDGNRIFYKYYMDFINISLISEVDLAPLLHKNFLSTVTILLLSGILILLLSLVLSFFLSSQYYVSIAKIISYLQSEIHQSNSDEDRNVNELTFIKNSILTVLNNNKDLEQQLSDNIINLKKSQSVMLQLQFNPHFLFNTLNMVSMKSIALTHSDNDVSRIITLLSDLLRISLDTDNYFTTINEELSFAEKYIEIEAIRYNHDFEVEWNVSPDIQNYNTVKLILQPIIENAFIHGLRRLAPSIKKKIIITAEADGQNMIFSVINNGFANETDINEIQRKLENDDIPHTNHIGMQNVNSRLKLLFGSEYGCVISRENNFTTVKIKTPII